MTAESCDKTGVARNSAAGGREFADAVLGVAVGDVGESLRSDQTPVLDHARGSSRWQGSPLIAAGAVELHGRPRALAVGWGHERLVGCRALSPAIGRRVPRTGWDQQHIRVTGDAAHAVP